MALKGLSSVMAACTLATKSGWRCELQFTGAGVDGNLNRASTSDPCAIVQPGDKVVQRQAASHSTSEARTRSRSPKRAGLMYLVCNSTIGHATPDSSMRCRP